MNVNGAFGAIDIAISGLKVQNQNLKTISSNIANAKTTDNGNGEPYRRLEAVFEAAGDGINGVQLKEIASDSSEFQKILNPSHPNADENGFVKMPNVNIPMEMINLNFATRTYRANAAVLKRYQRMVETTLGLLK